jgi:hypothetical protein
MDELTLQSDAAGIALAQANLRLFDGLGAEAARGGIFQHFRTGV